MNKIVFFGFTYLNNKIYFVDTYFRIPGCLNTQTGEIDVKKHIKNYELKITERLWKAYTFKKKQYLFFQQSIMIWDVETDSCKYINIDKEKLIVEDWLFICEWNGKMFVLVNKGMAMVLIEDEEIMHFNTGLCEPIECACADKNQINLFPKQGKHYYSIDLDMKTIEKQECIIQYKDIISCVKDDNSIYLLNSLGIIYQWSLSDKKMKVFNEDELGVRGKWVGRILSTKNHLIILPLLDEEIRFIHKETKEVLIYKDYPKDFKYYEEYQWSKYREYCEDDKFYYLLRKSNYLLMIDKYTSEFVWKKIISPQENEIMWAQLSYTNLLYEGVNEFHSFLDSVVLKHEFNEEENRNKGEIIWRRIT